jgi:hypothetical protein
MLFCFVHANLDVHASNFVFEHVRALRALLIIGAWVPDDMDLMNVCSTLCMQILECMF